MLKTIKPKNGVPWFFDSKFEAFHNSYLRVKKRKRPG